MVSITSTARHADFVKVVVYGKSGSGKTTLAGTAPDPIIISAEGGLMALADKDIPSIAVKYLHDLDDAYDLVINSDHKTVCLDSLSEIAEVVLSYEKANNKDGRAAYGKTNDVIFRKIRKFRDIQDKHVYCTAKLMNDDDGNYMPSMPGKRMTNEVPYFFDLVMVLRIGEDEEGDNYRYLQTQPDIKYVAKDRSGKLNSIERPDLTLIFNKIISSNQPKPEDDYAE